jgi:hypothetical protein
MTPGMFLVYAEEFLAAAECANKKKLLIPKYYLLGHSIELSLKAFLMKRGNKLSDLRSHKFGHNLYALLRESRRRKLGKVVPFR